MTQVRSEPTHSVLGGRRAVAASPPDLSGVPERREGRRHILDLDDFSPAEILGVMQNTDVMKEVLHRDIKKVPTLRGKTVITLF